MPNVFDQIHTEASNAVQASGGNVFDQIHAENKPSKGGFGQGFVDSVNVIPTAKRYLYDVPTEAQKEVCDNMDAGDYLGAIASSAKNAITVPTQLIRDLVHGSAGQIKQAQEAFKKGDYSRSALHAYGAIPVVGPAVADAAENLSDPNTRSYGAGQVAGNAVMAALPKVAGKVLPKTVPISPRFTSTLDSAEQAAVDFGMANNIPLDAATLTGNKAVQNVQNLLQNSPGVAGYARKARLAQADAMGQVGDKLAEQVSPTPANPEVAGQAVRDALTAQADQHAKDASSAYNRLSRIENSPSNAKDVQVGTKTVDSGVVGPDGKPIIHQQPITKTMALPVDMRPVKQALQPLYDDLKSQMPIAQQRASYGLKALENVMNGDDFQPASIADQNLSAMKAIQREAVTPKAKYVASQVIHQASGAVNQAVQAAGPEAFDALTQGRDLTKAKYATQETLEKLRTEPVQLFNQLTYGRDTGVNLLRDVASKAPNSLPAVGRAYMEGLMEKAFAEAGTAKPGTALTDWQKLGPETKQTLFRTPENIANLDNFFTLAKKMSENPNPSGTAYVAQIGGDGALLVTAPHLGVPYVIGKAAIARMLLNPKSAQALTAGLRIPIANKAAAPLLATQILKLAGDSAQPANQ